MKHFVSFLASGLLLATAAQAQTKLSMPPLSPTTHIHQNFSTSYIDLTYSRPSLRGRGAFGKLVPNGTVWRTGANTITKVRFGEEVKINGQTVPAGAYALLTIPDAKEWTFILNRDTAQWGTYSYKQALDVLRVNAKPTKLAAPVETMSLTVENLKTNAADLVVTWDRTQVALPITADPDRIVMGQIEQAMKSDKKPYITAAQYYFNAGKDLTPAVGWIDEAIKASPSPSYYHYYWKAKLLQKQGKNKEAIEAANKSLELVQSDNNEVSKAEYIHLNQELLAAAGSKK
jgi:tetratricopeptide (TPR) repeat protein